MNKFGKSIITVGVLVVGIGFALWYAQPDNSEPPAAVAENWQLKGEPAAYDFGTISMKDGKVSQVFKVRNENRDRLNIDMVYTSCMCTEAKIISRGEEFGPFGMQGHGVNSGLDRSIDPNEEIEVVVIFDPNAHGPSGVGPIERVVTLEGNEHRKLVEFNVKANVTP